jgi:hypothetical protein
MAASMAEQSPKSPKFGVGVGFFQLKLQLRYLGQGPIYYSAQYVKLYVMTK